MLFLAACQHFSNAEPVERLLAGTRFPAVVLAMDCLLSLVSDNYCHNFCVHSHGAQVLNAGGLYQIIDSCQIISGCHVVVTGNPKGFFFFSYHTDLHVVNHMTKMVYEVQC